jgi:hypothetical protein
MDIKSIPPDQLHEWAVRLGKRGGEKTKEMYGISHYKEMRSKSKGRRKVDIESAS